MNKVQFLQEKMAYLIRYPDQTETDFYRHLTERFPKEAAGWLHLGLELERQGDWKQALHCYRQALRAPANSLFRAQARDAYRRLLRKRHRHWWRSAGRRLLALAALTLVLTLIPHPTLAPLHSSAPLQTPDSGRHAATTEQTAAIGEEAPQHAEVIAVPSGWSGRELQAQVKRYLAARRVHFAAPFTVILVPQEAGLPSFTPLLFYRPTAVKGVVRFDPTRNKLLEETYFDAACDCADHPHIRAAKQALSEEQQALEQVLLLRNAVYRFYQQTGRLPAQLQELTKPAPANWLSALPQPAVPSRLRQPSQQQADVQWVYRPQRFRPAAAWASLTEVLPLPYFPEPVQSLEPLQIIVHKPSYRLLLTSGPHLVRQYPVGIGKNNATPDGYFTILRKIHQPEGSGNVYGTRGMTFASPAYAIHGTNDPRSIGKAVSLGCIRLHNADVEELYSFVSPGTPVIVSAQAQPLPAWTNGGRLVIPAGNHEKTPGVTYHWLH
ncbi:L,D-transpeptidase [Brevibacillus marinus]|uniref:L,D-transpeptidase n=1 Tax=Brevibacillus marinus TaxID=2496837 RepID=UPI000F826B85|nr:L,D-transpeptidase family protein [Brevibacillus marinus]